MTAPLATIPTPTRDHASAARAGPDRDLDAHPDAHRARLTELVEVAATLDLADQAGWERLRADGVTTSRALIAAGAVPAYLAVRPGEPPVVVRRTLAAIARRLAPRRSLRLR